MVKRAAGKSFMRPSGHAVWPVARAWPSSTQACCGAWCTRCEVKQIRFLGGTGRWGRNLVDRRAPQRTSHRCPPMASSPMASHPVSQRTAVMLPFGRLRSVQSRRRRPAGVIGARARPRTCTAAAYVDPMRHGSTRRLKAACCQIARITPHAAGCASASAPRAHGAGTHAWRRRGLRQSTEQPVARV
jgi:hypothetical protein